MNRDFKNSLIEAAGSRELYEQLANRLSGSRLYSLLLEVFLARAARISPAQLLRTFGANTLLHPVEDAIAVQQRKLALYRLAQAWGAAPVELSPVAPFACCSALGPVSQNKVLTALRGTEVVADATNMLALYLCHRTGKGLPDTTQRAATQHRHLRTQGKAAHFQIFCTTALGRDRGGFAFEREELLWCIGFYQALLREEGLEKQMVLRLFSTTNDPTQGKLCRAMAEAVRLKFPGLMLAGDGETVKKSAYYCGLNFRIDIQAGGEWVNLVDGGAVDWAGKLLQNQKARMFLAGMGVERLERVRLTDSS